MVIEVTTLPGERRSSVQVHSVVQVTLMMLLLLLLLLLLTESFTFSFSSVHPSFHLEGAKWWYKNSFFLFLLFVFFNLKFHSGGWWKWKLRGLVYIALAGSSFCSCADDDSKPSGNNLDKLVFLKRKRSTKRKRKKKPVCVRPAQTGDWWEGRRWERTWVASFLPVYITLQ